MKIYMGFRVAGLCYVYKWDAEMPQRPQRLDPRLDLRQHSPTGMEWGYMGSGPAQLALALAADALEDDARALRVYQYLKGPVQHGMHRDCWSITADRLLEMICEVEDHNRDTLATRANMDKEFEEGGQG